MTFEKLKLVYPNNWRKNIPNRSCFSWFLCSKKYLDENGYYSIDISPKAQFYSEDSGKTYSIIQNSDKIKIRLLLVNEPHNKRKLISRDFHLKCDSNRDILSQECPLVNDINHLIEIAKYVEGLKYGGIAFEYEGKDCVSSPVCQQALFIINSNLLESKKQVDCEIIKYAKQHNTELRSIYPDFPDCKELNRLSNNYPCNLLSKVIYNRLNRS